MQYGNMDYHGISRNISDLIGNTPMIRINKLTGPEYASIYAKLEMFNIGGSVKDRAALNLIEFAEANSTDPGMSRVRLDEESRLALGAEIGDVVEIEKDKKNRWKSLQS